MTATLDSNVGDVVAADFRAATVFERYGIDFCCGGRRTIADACREQRVNPLDVLIHVNATCDRTDRITPRFAEWGVDALVAYVVRHHHAYLRRVLPPLVAHTQRIATHHGGQHPELREIAETFAAVADDLTAYMAKEEEVLFPYIEDLAIAFASAGPAPAAPFGDIEDPIRMMEHEHDFVADAMGRIHTLSHGYTPPAGACTTYAVCFRELEDFERDLHVHVHLENNLLFPKARALDAIVRKRA